MQKSKILSFIPAAILASAFWGLAPASAEDAPASETASSPIGDPAAGKKVFSQCGICHSLEAGKNKIGPHLSGLWGREAGSIEGFRYSPAMKNSGIVWNDETLTVYLANPKATVPGTIMATGVRKPSDIPNLLAYLKQETAAE